MARSTQKKEAILTAAISEFKQKGFENTSMDQVALTAVVSKRTVYNHFASKELLFDAILEKMVTLFSTAVFIKYQDDVSLAIQLTDIAKQELTLLADPAFVDLAKVIMAEMMHTPQRINKVLAEVESRDGDLSSWLKSANANGALKVDDVDFAATQFFALLKSFCFWPQVIQDQPFPDKTQQKHIINSAVDMFLGYYQAGNN